MGWWGWWAGGVGGVGGVYWWDRWGRGTASWRDGDGRWRAWRIVQYQAMIEPKAVIALMFSTTDASSTLTSISDTATLIAVRFGSVCFHSGLMRSHVSWGGVVVFRVPSVELDHNSNGAGLQQDIIQVS